MYSIDIDFFFFWNAVDSAESNNCILYGDKCGQDIEQKYTGEQFFRWIEQ